MRTFSKVLASALLAAGCDPAADTMPPGDPGAGDAGAGDAGAADDRYRDSFDDEPAGADPSHWIEPNTTNAWTVAEVDGSRSYRHRQTHDAPESWLHVFERDVVFEARMKYLSHDESNAKLRLAVRFNHEHAWVYAGYDFNTSTWHIKDRQGADFDWTMRAESAVEELEPDRWYTLRVVASGATVKLYVDDMVTPKLEADDVAHQSPGRVALSALGTEAFFDDVHLTLTNQEGRVQDGVLEYTVRPEDEPIREGVTIVVMNDGSLELLHRRERFHSTDGGRTFDGPGEHIWPDDAHSHHSILRLRSGDLLKLQAEYDVDQPTSDSPLRFRSRLSADDGSTWSAPSDGLTWTSYREGLPGQSAVIQMNDKLTQISSGRIFFVATVRVVDGGEIVGHKCEVYFSDDGGLTWSRSANDTSSVTEQSRYAEGKVIETASGELRLYVPWNESGTVRYSVSTDGGITWTGDHALDQLKNARSSFGLIEDPYAPTPTFYLAWVYNDITDHPKVMFPRSRLSLARSHDGVSWEYLMDVERWISPDDPSGNPIVQIVDPGITASPDHLFITMGRAEKDVLQETHNAQKLRIVRVDKDKLRPYRSWPREY